MLKCIFGFICSQSTSCRPPNFFAEICFSNFYLLIFIVGQRPSQRRCRQNYTNHHRVAFKTNLILCLIPSFLLFLLRKKIGVIPKNHDILKFERDEVVSGSSPQIVHGKASIGPPPHHCLALSSRF